MSDIKTFTYEELENQGDFLPEHFYHPKSLYDESGGLMTNEKESYGYVITNNQIHLTQYKEKKAKIIKCKNCGNCNFIVAVEDYYTAIKCPNCKWEQCIHEG